MSQGEFVHLAECAYERCLSAGDDPDCCECTCSSRCETCGSRFFSKTTTDPKGALCRWCYGAGGGQ